MEKTLLDRAVGLVLALLFAAVMGLCVAAVLIADYVQPGQIMSQQARQTLTLCGIAGAIAGLASWWLQGFAAQRGLIVRFFYGLGIFMLVFAGTGGILEIVRNFMANPGPTDFSLGGVYWASLSGFYSFALFLVVPLRIALVGVLLAAGIILALAGPRERARRA